MSKPETCMRCGGADLIPAWHLQTGLFGGGPEVVVTVAANPEGFLVHGVRREALQACVCTACGHVETYVFRTEHLKAAHEASLKRSGTP